MVEAQDELGGMIGVLMELQKQELEPVCHVDGVESESVVAKQGNSIIRARHVNGLTRRNSLPLFAKVFVDEVVEGNFLG